MSSTGQRFRGLVRLFFRRLGLPALGLLLPAHLIFAQAPAVIHYQGRVLAGATAFQGTGQFKFALVNADASVTYWRNASDANSDGEPDSAVSAPVTRGLYSVLLGDSTLPNMAALPANLFNNSSVHLRVWFTDGLGAFERLIPDQRIVAVGYAMIASSVTDGAITLDKLANDARSAVQAATDQAADADARADSLQTQIDAAHLRIDGITNQLSGITNQVSGITNDVSALVIQIAALNNRLDALSLSEIATPPGLTASSTDPADATLLAQGFVSFTSTTPAPWVNGATLNAAAARSAHTAVWTGDAWIIWGGDLGGGVLSDAGAIYQPSADAWETVSPAGRPAARNNHTAVWTGLQMIVWGGFSAGEYLSRGGRFSPGTGEWLPTATTGGPAGRLGHVAVWTGSRMLIWGGRNSGGLLNDGALYDPVTDQWTALSLPNPPEARQDTAYTWAGDRLIIWGGLGLGGSLDTGAQLLFAAGNPTAWSPLNSALAPSARVDHSMVWTGQEAVVWGGKSGGVFLDNGAAYNPAANTWRTLNVVQAPSARAEHGAVWTGTEMVILNGDSATGALATSAAYNPATDRWRALTNIGSPQARIGAVSAWTGSEALVFGGRVGSAPIAALQRLNPQPAWTFYRKP